MKRRKRTLFTLLSFLGCMAVAVTTTAQDSDLLPDQNPRFAESVNKYSKIADSLTQTQGTTVQQTYKAYDWYEAREERRKLRRERNHQYSLALGYNYGNYWSYPAYRYSGHYTPYFGLGTNNYWLGW